MDSYRSGSFRPRGGGTFRPSGDREYQHSNTFDGKRMRKAIQRRTIDYNSVVFKHLEVNKRRPLQTERIKTVGSRLM
ncbi:hypothetical protein BC830DRAFT_1128995 [Chytriomyces sp. MP71]|nr:hypothetical protein BC830DRAFT_1128995 [Chytriomyces sp. MP71]